MDVRYLLAQDQPPPAGASTNPVLNAITWAGEHFIGLFNEAGKQFAGLVTGILPTLIVLLTFMYAMIAFIGEDRVTRAVQWSGRWMITRYTIMPILAVLVLTNPMCYTFGRFLRERHKPAFYDSAVSFVHPVTTFFPYANAGELFVWLGVAAGVREARRVARPARDPVLPGRHRGHLHPRGLHRADHRLPHPPGGQDRGVRQVRRRVRRGRRRRCEVTTTDHTSGGRTFRSVFVRAGRGGWGRGLELTPTPDKYKVISVTGGGIHPVAQRIAELTGGEAVDGFRTKVEDAETLAAVINCGGTARIGVYPRKRIPTVDVFPGEPGGPLAQFITEDIFVSAVGTGDVSLVEEQTVSAGTAAGGDGRSRRRRQGGRALADHRGGGRGGRAAPPVPSHPCPTSRSALAGAEGVLRQVRHRRRLHHQHLPRRGPPVDQPDAEHRAAVHGLRQHLARLRHLHRNRRSGSASCSPR